MDTLTVLRSVATVLCFATFVGILVWAYSRRNAERFEEAAQLPLQD
ncbi:MAG: cbb3-type cytochrome c oxidase subunit 3 [Betaproteobacteria bacterium]|jgi:cytochrome c oxidase cbb3-type subunit 4|nr:cbb3-type cytochrome c oxidase subunit 3 [Betaproteobacteria bacterium]MBK7656050.1 cbb3-type cytochrome c oxidase subunit 3 [Betaproteobacteria bacterium]